MKGNDVVSLMQTMSNKRKAKHSIRQRTRVVFLAALVLFSMMSYAVQRWVLMPSFVALEESKAEADLNDCRAAITREVDHLQQTAGDWAAWDDTYEFMVSRDEEFVDSNLVEETFTDNDLNLICIQDTEGAVVWAEVHDIVQEETIEVEEFPEVLALKLGDLTGQDLGVAGQWGIVATARGPMLLAVRPVLTSENGGPSRGDFKMGRFLDGTMVADLVEQTGVAFTLLPLANGQTAEAERARFVKEDQKTLLVEGYLKDLHGMPKWLVQARVPRDITEKGRAAIHFAFLMSLAAGLVTLLLLDRSLGHTAVSPLLDLTARVVRINEEGDLSSRLDIGRDDEIGTLGEEFDRLLNRVHRDMDERKQAEAALKKSQRRIWAIWHAVPNAILTIEEDGTVESINPAGEAMFGYPHRELVGQLFDVLVDDPCVKSSDGDVARRLKDACEKSDGFGTDANGVRKDGTTFPIYVTASNVRLGDSQHGDRVLATVVISDMTGYRDMHRQLMEAQHLARIGQMSTTIAHEIRNPLAGISAAIHVVGHALPQDDLHRNIINEVQDQVTRLDQTIHHLLLFSKPWSAEKTVCPLRQLVADVRADMEKKKAFQNIAFELNLPHDLTAHVDARLFCQVLWNLFRNARQAMTEGGTIGIEASRNGACVRLSVCDTGPGIPEELRERVFEPFFTTRTRGTGLGLTVCRQIMEAHGGSITVADAPGRGTRITLEFPEEPET